MAIIRWTWRKIATSTHELDIAEVVSVEDCVVVTEGAALGEIEPDNGSAALGEIGYAD